MQFEGMLRTLGLLAAVPIRVDAALAPSARGDF